MFISNFYHCDFATSLTKHRSFCEKVLCMCDKNFKSENFLTSAADTNQNFPKKTSKKPKKLLKILLDSQNFLKNFKKLSHAGSPIFQQR